MSSMLEKNMYTYVYLNFKCNEIRKNKLAR